MARMEGAAGLNIHTVFFTHHQTHGVPKMKNNIVITSRSAEKFTIKQSGNTLKTPFTRSTLGGHWRKA